MKLLLVEDEKDLSRAIYKILSINSYECDQAYDGIEALELINNYNYDAVIMDIMMPKMNGIEVVKKVRQNGNNVPIILLTAKTEIDDKVLGLDSGADDYLTKPFMVKELLARIRAITRRKGNMIEPNSLGDLVLDPNTYELKAKGVVRLTNKEYKLIDYLIRNTNTLLSSENILNNVWEYDSESEINTVWVYISALRKKLEEVGSTYTIKAIRGLGYKLEKKEDKNV